MPYLKLIKILILNILANLIIDSSSTFY